MKLEEAIVLILAGALILGLIVSCNEGSGNVDASKKTPDIIVHEFEYKGMPCIWAYATAGYARGGPSCDWTQYDDSLQ